RGLKQRARWRRARLMIMDPSLPLIEQPGDYIAGQFVRPDTIEGELRIHSPADLAQHVSTHAYGSAQIDRAIEAARAAASAWRRASEDERRTALRRYQDR